MTENKSGRELVDELSTYLYGLTIIFGFSLLMLFIHLGLDFFFHN